MPKHTDKLYLNENEESNALFSAILHTTHDAVIAIDHNQNIILFNQGAKQIFGYNTSSEVIGQPLDILLPSALSEIHRAYVRKFSESAITTKMMDERREVLGRRRDGTIFPAEASIAKVSSDGKTFFSVILRDVTERKHIEKMLRENERNLIESQRIAHLGHWQLDLTNNQLEWSDEIFRIFEIDPKEFGATYETFLEFVHPEDRQFVNNAYTDSVKNKTPYDIVHRLLMKDGRIKFVNERCETFFTDDGKPLCSLGTVQDITERKRAEAEILRRLQNIQALQKIDQAIAGSLDLKLTLNVVLEQTKTELKVDAAAILLFNPHVQVLEFAAGIGFYTKAIEKSRLRLGEGHGGRAASERKTVSIANLLENNNQFVRAALLADEGLVTYFGTPLIAKGQVRGVLEVFHRSPFTPSQDWLDFLEVLAGQSAVAVDNASLFADLQHSNTELFNAYDSTIEGWSRALDLRDKETEGHTQRVTELTLKLARASGISEQELRHVQRGALLHDIGKMGVPDAILLKPDKLTDEEWIIMRKHPVFAFELLSPIAYLRPALDIPYCHHEKWDGSGYPRGLKGDQIPLAARLFSVIDVWDALRSDRPYRQAWSVERVKEHIKSLSGTHFDPKAVDLFLNMISEEEKNAG